MPKANLNARSVLNMKPSADGRVDYFDDDPPGFGLRLSSSGKKTWFFLYRSPTRKREGRPLQIRLALGTYPATSLAKARKKAHDAHRDVEDGTDPGEVKREIREAGTFGDLATTFLRDYRKKNGARKISADEDARIVRKELLPAWQYRSATAITRRDVLDLITAIADGTGRKRPAPILANRVLLVISTLYNWALRQPDWKVEANPAHLIGRVAEERARERWLNESEIRAVWTALDHETPDHRAFYRLAVLSGQRCGGKRDGRGELLRMKWSEVDKDSRWWTIPGSRTKNGKPNRVYLAGLALEQLAAMRAYHAEHGITSEYVFATTRTIGEPAAASGRTIERVCKRSGVDFRPHDLRRTMATLLASHGEPRAIIGKLLNHSETGVTATVYDRYTYDAEIKRAFEHWERLVKAALHPTKTGAAVLPMPRRAS